MGKYIVNKSDFIGNDTVVQLAGSFGSDVNKSLKAVISFDSKTITFNVIANGNVVSSESELEDAINAYNEV